MSNKKRVQFIEPYKSKELNNTQHEFQVFQDYNSEHLLQFKSPRPTQSFSENITKMEPKIQSLLDDDIELDDNGESVATKREMLQKFQQFDVFLIKNREKIEGKGLQQQQQQQQQQNQQQMPSLLDADLKTNRLNVNNPSNQDIPSFSGLKDIRIDFNRVASNIPANQLQEIMSNNQGNTNNEINSYMNSGRFLMLNGINPSSDSIQNGETFSFFQNKRTGRRQNKAMTLAQTQNIQGVTTNFHAFGQTLENKKVGIRSVQDVILRLSIRSSLMVYKFLRMMKRKIRLNGLQDLTNQQLMYINDLSHYQGNDNNKNKSRMATAISHIIRNKILIVFSMAWKYVKQQLESCLSCIAESRPIDPTSNWMLLWLIIQFIFIIVALFYTPLELINGDAYDKKYGRPWVLYKIINCLAFFLDIIIKFNTGLFEKGQIVMNRKEIVKTYFKGNFFFDILALIPITQTLLQIDYLRPINLLILLKVQTARRILTQIQEMISQKNNKLQHALSLLQLLLMICSVCHIFACLFMGIAVLEERYNLTSTNWMEKYDVAGENVHWFVKYNCSLYFAVTTMITVGYGDIAPVTTYEIFFVTIAMFVSCGVFAYSFNQIGDLVREQNRMSNEFKNEMVLVNRLLEKKKINRDLKLQVRKFLEYRFYAEPQLSMEEERMVMSKLSHHLREKVILESNLQIINQCTLLTNNFSKQFLENLALKMNELRVSKNEIIFEQNDQDDDPSLYIVDKGNIEIFIETDKQEQDITILQVLNQGSYFGEMNFFKEGLRSASARASDFTILYGIPKSQFLETISDYPRDFEQYCFMKDSLIYDNKIRVIDMKCFVCGRDDHLSRNCHLIHFVPDKEKIILKDNFSTKQKRAIHERNGYSKFNSLKNMKLVVELQDQYMSSEQNQQYIQISYNFLLEEPSLTEENANVDVTHNTSNIGGVPTNNLPNANYILPNNINNNNNNYGINNNYQRDKQPTLLPDIKRHVSNVYTSGGSVLGDMSHKNDQSKNDISEVESPRSNDRGQTQAYNNYQQNTPNLFSTQNTNSNFYPPLQNNKTPSNRFGHVSAFQQQQNGFLGVNSYATFGNAAKKKTALKKFGAYAQEEDDNGHNNSYQAQSPNNAMLQQLMAMIQKAMAPPQNNNYGYSQQNINSFSALPHFNAGPSFIKGKNYAGGSSKQHTHESEDIGLFGNYSRNRANTRYLSYLHKKREKELLLQQMQLNNQFYQDGMQNIDISPFFEKSKIYTVYYPQHNLNTVLKAIENQPLKQLKQPDYFGVYSFQIRPQSKRKQLQQKEEQYLHNPSGNMKNSQAIINQNGNGMHNSTIIFNNNPASKFANSYFNQSFGLRHKGSLNNFKDSPKPVKDSDSFKQKKNSLKPFNSLNHLKASTLRTDSLVFGNLDKAPTKSNFGQINNASECASIYQEKEKIYYPKFIFKKLFTLS